MIRLMMLMLTMVPGLSADEPDLLQAIPADAWAVISLADMDESLELIHGSAWGRFAGDPGLDSIKNAIASLFDESGELDEGELKDFLDTVRPGEWVESLKGDMAFFFRLNDLEKGLFSMGLLIDPGEEREAFENGLGRFKDYLRRQAGDSLSEDLETYEGIEIELFDEGRSTDETPRLLFADQGDAFLIVADLDAEAGLELTMNMIDALNGVGEMESFRDREDFASLHAEMGEMRHLETFFDFSGMIRILKTAMQKEADESEEALGLLNYFGVDGVKHFYTGAQMGEGETLDFSLHVGIEGEGVIRDVLDEVMGGELPLYLLDLVPENAISANGYFLDLGAMARLVFRVLEELDPNTYESVRQGYEEMLVKRFRIDPEKELLELLDGRLMGFVIPVPEEEAAPLAAMSGPDLMGLSMYSKQNQGFLISLGLKDGKAFRANFERTLRALGLFVSLRKEEFQGNTLFRVQLPIPGLMLHWAFSEDLWAISLFPTPLREFLRLRSGGDLPAMGKQDRVKKITGTFRRPSGYSVADTAKQVQQFASAFLQGVQLGIMSELDFSTPQTPPVLAAIMELKLDPGLAAKYFEGLMVSWYRIDERGIEARAFSRGKEE